MKLVVKDIKQQIALLSALLMLAPAGYGQAPFFHDNQTMTQPFAGGRSPRLPAFDQKPGIINGLTRKYRSQYAAPVDVSNTGRLDQLIRAGNLYLSLNDAIALALENNIGLELQRYNFEVNQLAYNQSLAGANGQFDPTFNMNTFNYQHSQSPNTQPTLSGTAAVSITDTYNRGFQLQQSFATGATATLGFTSSKSNNNNSQALFAPNLQGGLSMNMTQPLLRGGGIALNTVNIKVAKMNLEETDYSFRVQINTLVNQVVTSYWNLVAAVLNVDVQRQSLETSQTQLDQNRKQVEIGTMAPVDVLQSEVNVATGEQGVITAETTVQTQEVALKNVISRNGIASASLAAVHIIPTNRVEVPDVEPVTPIQDLYDTALKNRPELPLARYNLQEADLQMKTAKNALLPQLNLTGLVSQPAQSGSSNPLSKTQPLPEFTGGYGNVLRQLFYTANVNYTLGLTLSINLRNRSQQAALATQQINYRTQELQLQQQINQIRADVSTAQINITSARARYQAALKAATTQEQVLDATQKKFALGATDLFQVISQQNTLTSTRQSLVTAQVGYATAKLALDVAMGALLDKYNIVYDEARAGQLSRRSDPIPDVVNPNGQAGVRPAAGVAVTPR